MKFIFDLDGTICFKGKPLSKKMVQALDSLMNKGHELVFASARPIRDLLPILPAHMQRLPMVGGNGAFVANGGHIIATTHFDQPTADWIVRLIREFKADYLIDSKWDYAYSSRIDHPIRRNLDPERRARNVRIDELEEIVKVVILTSLNGQRLLEELKKLQVMIYKHGTEDILDISPKGVDKWIGLQALGINSLEFIAFGNDANDLSMFRHAKHSVCVGDHSDLSQLSTEKVLNDEEHVVKKIYEIADQTSLEELLR